MDEFLRELVRQRYVFRCGYCGVSESEVGSRLTIDHFMPQSKGGTDALGNLVYSCHACNSFKKDFWTTHTVRRLLHPWHDDVSLHIRENEEGELEALTPTGAFHIRRLRLNRVQLIAQR